MQRLLPPSEVEWNRGAIYPGSKMRCLSALVAAMALCLTSGATNISIIGGVNLIGEGFEGLYPFGSPEMKAAIAAAHGVGCKWVCLSFVAQYTASINSTGPFYAVPGGTPSGAPFRNASTPSASRHRGYHTRDPRPRHEGHYAPHA